MKIYEHNPLMLALAALLVLVTGGFGLTACETDEVDDRYATEPYGVEPGVTDEEPAPADESTGYRIDEPGWLNPGENDEMDEPYDSAFVDEEPGVMDGDSELENELELEGEPALPPDDELPPMR